MRSARGACGRGFGRGRCRRSGSGGLEAIATDGGVGLLPGFVQRAEGGRNILRELGADGGVDGIGARETFEILELSECADNFLWIGQNGIGVKAGAGRFGKWEPGSGLFRCGFGHKERSLERPILGGYGAVWRAYAPWQWKPRGRIRMFLCGPSVGDRRLAVRGGSLGYGAVLGAAF